MLRFFSTFFLPSHPALRLAHLPLSQLGAPAPKGHSYIASSYVKLVESAGARAVPIMCDMSKEEVKRRFKVRPCAGAPPCCCTLALPRQHAAWP